jgi:hypothetical protein
MLDVKQQYNRLKASALSRGIYFDLTASDLNELSYPITCPILGIPLKCNAGKADDNSYSIDRIDNSLGYTIDNIQVISLRANKLKSDATVEELKLLYEYYSMK